MDLTRLSVGDSGSKIARVHERLKTAGFTVPGDETRRMFFGPATRDAVLRYQAVHGLAATGIIDEPTVESLDAAILADEELPVTQEPTVGNPKAGAPISVQPPLTATLSPSTAGEAGAELSAEASASPAGTDVYVVTGVVSSSRSAAVGG